MGSLRYLRADREWTREDIALALEGWASRIRKSKDSDVIAILTEISDYVIDIDSDNDEREWTRGMFERAAAKWVPEIKEAKDLVSLYKTLNRISSNLFTWHMRLCEGEICFEDDFMCSVDLMYEDFPKFGGEPYNNDEDPVPRNTTAISWDETRVLLRNSTIWNGGPQWVLISKLDMGMYRYSGDDDEMDRECHEAWKEAMSNTNEGDILEGSVY